MRKFLFLYLIFTSFYALSQSDFRSSINIQPSYLVEIPGGDLAKRFGVNNKFEGKIEYLHKYNYAFYIKSGLRLGEKVNDDVLATLRTSDGFVIGVNGFYADIFGRKRGIDIGLGIDKLIPVNFTKSETHHLRIGIAGMYMHHWIRLVDDSRSVPQIIDAYALLYDRYTAGFALEENIQFQYNVNKDNSSFLLGIQFAQGFTRDYRSNFIDALTNRVDLYFGLKISYLLPLYHFGDREETIYY